MYKIIMLFSSLFLLIFTTRAQMPVCCTADAMTDYSRNGGDEQFRKSHDAPLPFHFESNHGKDIRFTTPDGQQGRGWEIKAAKPSPYYLFVVHEWWGLNDYIKKESERLWKDLGVNVIALDLYDGKVATTAQEAGATMQALSNERARSIIQGAINYVGPQAKILTVGWCFGGGWSLQTALMAGKQTAGCVMYYGQPETDVEKLKTLNTDVLGFFGNLDKWPDPKTVDAFAENMKKAGKPLQLQRYEAGHAFANPSNPNFSKDIAEDAYARLLKYFRSKIS